MNSLEKSSVLEDVVNGFELPEESLWPNVNSTIFDKKRKMPPESLWPDFNSKEWCDTNFTCFRRMRATNGIEALLRSNEKIEKWRITHVQGNLFCLACKTKEKEVIKQIFDELKEIDKKK